MSMRQQRVPSGTASGGRPALIPNESPNDALKEPGAAAGIHEEPWSLRARQLDVVVIGGGLAGLAAATLLARAGRKVELLERAALVGGRARMRERAGFNLNLGPHALYRGGAGAALLAELGVPHAGAEPPDGAVVTGAGRMYPIPATPLALLRHPGLALRARLGALRFFAAIARGPLPPAALSFDAWLAQRGAPPELAALLRAFLRLSTYVAASDRLSAQAAALQLRQAIRGVVYVHDGWDTLVDGLALRAGQAGVRIRSGCAATAVRAGPEGPRAVLASGEVIAAKQLILAVPPQAALELLGPEASPALRRFRAKAQPVLAACLDIGLRRLPRPDVALALDLDHPRYLSCHSVARGLAPNGRVLLQLAHYGADDGSARSGLESWLDTLQPGWREEVIMERWLPAARVMEALPDAASGGLGGRPAVDAAGPAGVLLCGDWVGPEGLLSDASLASARAAARAACGAAQKEV